MVENNCIRRRLYRVRSVSLPPKVTDERRAFLELYVCVTELVYSG